MTLLDKLRASNSPFASFEKKANSHPETKGIGLAGYLIKPVQRICKYPLLVQEMLKHTPEDHKEAQELHSSYQSISSVVDYINARQHIHANQQKLSHLRDTIDGIENFDIVKPDRTFISEFTAKKERVLFLLSDFLLIVKHAKKERFNFKQMIPISRLQIDPDQKSN